MWVKVVALTLIQSFLGWNAASAAVSERSMWQQRGKVSQIGTSVSSNTLEQESLQKGLFAEYFVPENAGTINEFWVPKGMDKKALSSSKLLIHVRDAHCNYEAQGNIAKVIDNFVSSNGLSFVAVEGAEGGLDYSLLRSFPNYDVLSNASDSIMKLGRLTGAEYANINSRKDFELFGAEDMKVYKSNLNNFRNTLKYKKEGVEFVAQIKDALNTLKANMYTPELKELEEMSSLYNNREISFVDYCQYLYNLPAAEKVRSGYKNFALLMEAIRVQDLIDFSQIDTEKTELVNELARAITRDDLSTLSRASIDFRRGKLSTAKYYETLGALAKEAQVDVASYKNLRPYMVYLNVYEQIDSAELFQEKETLETEIKRSLFKNLDQARLDKLSKNADILEKVFAVRLTNADLAYFQDFRTDFTAWEFKSFIQEQAPKYNLTFNVDFSKDPIDKYLPELEAFYMEAKTRDAILVDNALAQMDLEGDKVGALISGGFHTAGITSYLRSKNVPYMVVTPRILREDVNNPYLELITGEKLPVEKLITQEFLFSLQITLDDKGNTEEIGTLAGNSSTLSNEDRAAWNAKAGFTNGQAGSLDGVNFVYQTVGNNLQFFTEDQAGLTAALQKLGKTVESLPLPDGSAVAQTEDKGSALKGDIQDASQAPLKAESQVAVAIDDLVIGNAAVKALVEAAVAKAGKGVPVYVSELKADQGYVGINQPDLALETAIKDQHVAIAFQDRVVLAEGLLYLIGGRYDLANPAAQAEAVDELVAIINHERSVSESLSKGLDRAAAHKEAVQVDQAAIATIASLNEAITNANLEGDNVALLQAYTFLDGRTVDANAELSQAVQALKAATTPEASKAASSAVVLAQNTLRDSTNTAVNQALVSRDNAIVPEALTRAASQDQLLGLFISDDKAYIADSAPVIGEGLDKAKKFELPEGFRQAVVANGISRVVFADNVSTATRARILATVIEPNTDVTQIVIPGVVISAVKVGEKDIRVSVQTDVQGENAAATKEAFEGTLSASEGFIADTVNQGDADVTVVVNADGLYDANGQLSAEALGTLKLSIAQHSRIPGLKVAVVGSNVAGIKDEITNVLGAERVIDQDKIDAKSKLALITVEGVSAADLGIDTKKVLSLPKIADATKETVRFDAAFGVATAWAINNDLASIFSQIQPLLLALGLNEEAAKAFVDGGVFNFAPVAPQQINLKAIALWIAA